MSVDPRRTDERTDERPEGAPEPPHPAEGTMAREVTDAESVDSHRPIPQDQPGGGAAPGGEPVAPPGQEGGGAAVPPPGSAEGGAPAGPPAAHEQVPR